MTTLDPFALWESEIVSPECDAHARILEALERLPYLKGNHADRAQIFAAAASTFGNADAWRMAAPVVLCMRNGSVPLSLNDLVHVVCRPNRPHNPPTQMEITWALEDAAR